MLGLFSAHCGEALTHWDCLQTDGSQIASKVTAGDIKASQHQDNKDKVKQSGEQNTNRKTKNKRSRYHRKQSIFTHLSHTYMDTQTMQWSFKTEHPEEVDEIWTLFINKYVKYKRNINETKILGWGQSSLTLCSWVATKVWKPGATPKPSSCTKGGSAWLWICTLTPASNAVSSKAE